MARPLSMLEHVTSWIINQPKLSIAEATRLLAELEPLVHRSLPEKEKRLARPPEFRPEKPIG